MTTATTRIILALTISAFAGLAIIPLARRSAEPAPSAPAPQKCTAVLAPGASC